MPVVHISEDLFYRLARQAQAKRQTLDTVATAILDAELPHFPPPALPPEHPQGGAWQKGFEEWQQEVKKRAADYPPGFELDVSRDAMYPDTEDGR